jgi:hypothetical protein
VCEKQDAAYMVVAEYAADGTWLYETWLTRPGVTLP